MAIFVAMDYLSSLNPAQREAVVTTEGPTLIIAGPGSGKTRVLTFRIAHLMRQGIDPFKILSLTFTNKASKEMRDRIEQVVGSEAKNLFMGTFHSVFARILRYEAPKLGYPSNFTIYDTDDAKSLIKSIVKEMGLDDKVYKANAVLYRISNAKNNLITADGYSAQVEFMEEDSAARRPKIADIYKKYTERCFRSGAMDFDDLLFKMYELLNKFPEVLHRYQHQFQYILIDEFQDTNGAQYAIVRMLADVYQNITVVGDDAQSIYAFRGATIDNILHFERDFPELNVCKLEQNYRSSKQIVHAANALIKHNKNQLAKEIWTENGEGQKIQINRTVSDNEEGRWVADTLYEHKMRGHLRNRDFAILYRTNAQSRAFEEALRRLNVPYVIYGGLSFYQRKEIKDLIAYLRLTVNHQDEEALRRIINYPARAIGKTTMEKLTMIAGHNNISLWDVCCHVDQTDLATRTKTAVTKFVTMIKSFAVMLKDRNAYDMAAFIAKSTGILKELNNDKTVEGVSRYENVQELLSGIKEFTEDDTVHEDMLDGNDELLNPEADKSLWTYLQNITLLTSADEDPANADSVKMMTVHAAKGLEFPVVFVVGMEEQLFPSGMSIYSREDLEEERRLFYVAVTRAEDHLFLSYSASRYKFGQLNYCEPSRFLGEIPSELVEMRGAMPSARTRFESTGRSGVTAGGPRLRRSAGTGVKPSLNPKVVRKDTAFDHKPSGDFVPSDNNALMEGMTVEHERFGMGIIQQIQGDASSKMAVIAFKSAGQKKLMLKFAKLRIV